MNSLTARIFSYWKTTFAAILAAAPQIIIAIHQSNPDAKWTLTASSIITLLTGLLAKDK